ncbi:MAG: TVP38/TMEM64 family protein [Burkholderiales bacterium]
MLIAIPIVFFALVLAWRYTPLADIATADQVLDWARSVGQRKWTALAVVAIYTPAAFIMFPRPLITLFAVVAFGPWFGFAVSMTGIVGSALATYATGRTLSPETVRRLAGEKLHKMSEIVRSRGLAAIFAVSIAPVAPFPVIGLAAGAVRIKVLHYLLGTIAGMLPGTLATTVFAREFETALEDPSRINYWVVAAVIVVFALIVFAVRRWMISLQEDASVAGKA